MIAGRIGNEARTLPKRAIGRFAERPCASVDCPTVHGVHVVHVDVQSEQAGLHRLAGYRDALRNGKQRGSTRLVRRTEFKAGGAEKAATELLELDERPDALLVANSAMAVGVLAALRAHGLRVGRDVGIVAFDDVPWAGLVDPPLTVVAQPAYEIGTVAAQLLLARMADNTRTATTTMLGARLIERGSSHRDG